MGVIAERLSVFRERRAQRRADEIAAKPERAQRKAAAEAQRRAHIREDHERIARR